MLWKLARLNVQLPIVSRLPTDSKETPIYSSVVSLYSSAYCAAHFSTKIHLPDARSRDSRLERGRRRSSIESPGFILRFICAYLGKFDNSRKHGQDLEPVDRTEISNSISVDWTTIGSSISSCQFLSKRTPQPCKLTVRVTRVKR